MKPLLFTKKELDGLCKKYDIVGHNPNTESNNNHYYYFFIRSQLFNPDGWTRIFNNGYYNSFIRFVYVGFGRYKFWKISERPDFPDDDGYYLFNPHDTEYKKFSSKKEIENWINETCLYVRNELPKIAKRNIVKNKLKEIDKDFV